jgi:hypothetical protein
MFSADCAPVNIHSSLALLWGKEMLSTKSVNTWRQGNETKIEQMKLLGIVLNCYSLMNLNAI